MSKKQRISENYLERVPVRPGIEWTKDENGIVTLNIENKGIFNRIAQKLFKKPKVSYIHLDENGSFVWQQIDGSRDITKIGELVEEHFGETAHPTYERLAQFFKVLDSYGFVKWQSKSE